VLEAVGLLFDPWLGVAWAVEVAVPLLVASGVLVLVGCSMEAAGLAEVPARLEVEPTGTQVYSP
jgi:hypothetical protein